MAAATFIVVAHFVALKAGKTGLLDVAFDIDQFDCTTPVYAPYLTAQAASEGRNGTYYCFFTGDDAMIYTAVAKTADATVDQKEMACLGVLFQRLEQLDADVSSRSAPGDAMTLTLAEREAIDTELSDTHGAGSWEGGGGAPTAEEIWAYGQRSLTEEATTTRRANTDDWTKTRGTAWIMDVVLEVDLSALTSNEDIIFTYKRDKSKDSDARSLIQISYNNGLLILNGDTTPGNTNWGIISILDETTGAIRIYISELATTTLALLKQPGDYDIVVIRESYGKIQRKAGKLAVTAEVTRATTAFA